MGGEFAPRLYKLTYARNHAHIHTYQTKSFLEEGGRFQMGNDMEYQRGTSTVEGDPLEDLPGTFQPLIPPPGNGMDCEMISRGTFSRFKTSPGRCFQVGNNLGNYIG